MQLTLTDEQRLLEASAIDVLAGEYDPVSREASVNHPHGCRPEVWRQFAELGWLSLPVPESMDGLGGNMIDLGLLMQALGRHLVVEPYHASVVLAARLLAALDDPNAGRWLAPMMSGERRVALAHGELGITDPYAAPVCRAARVAHSPDGWRLHGLKPLVSGAAGVGALLVSARDDEGRVGVFHVANDAPGLRLHACRLTDGGRAADVHMDAAHASRLGQENVDALPTLQRVLAHGVVAQCWEAHGAMRAALERTVAYTAARIQFGQAMSRFQVVQHRLAEMLVCCEEAQAACRLAALRIDLHPVDLDTALFSAALVKSKVGRTARYVAQEAVQLHGAMGVCEELPIAATFRKLTAFAQQFGSPAWHAALLGRTQLASGAWRVSQTLLEPDMTPA